MTRASTAENKARKAPRHAVRRLRSGRTLCITGCRTGTAHPLRDSFAQGVRLSRPSLSPVLITALGVSKLTPRQGGELSSMETSSQLSQFSQNSNKRWNLLHN